jgi:hypothetical protein
MADPMAKKKPGLALVVSAGAKKGPSEPADDDYDAVVDELADTLGVRDDNRDAFKEAFRAAVMSCK